MKEKETRQTQHKGRQGERVAVVAAVRGKGKLQEEKELEEKGAGRCRGRINMVSCRQAQLQTKKVVLQKKSAQLSLGKWHVLPSTHTWCTARTKWSVWQPKDNMLFHSQQSTHKFLQNKCFQSKPSNSYI